MVSDAPTPHSPPIAMPNMARSTSRTVRLGAKPDANSMNEYNRTLTIKVGRRPQRSAARPNKYAPTGRIASVNKMAKVTSVICVPNSAAMSLRTKTRRKKSKASSVQPRKVAATTCFWSLVQSDSAAMRMAALFRLALALDFGLGPVVAARQLLVPFAVLVFPGNSAGFTRHVLFLGDAQRRGASRIVGRERLGEYAVDFVGPAAVVLDYMIGDL